MELTLEKQGKPTDDGVIHPGIAMTPSLGSDYWQYRVMLGDKQAIVGFPKFFMTGIGFAVEADDWNTNLPSTCDAVEIYDHIECNKGDESISREDCIAAIRLIQDAVRADQNGGPA